VLWYSAHRYVVGDILVVWHVCSGVCRLRLSGIHPRLRPARSLRRLCRHLRRQLLSALCLISSLPTRLIRTQLCLYVPNCRLILPAVRRMPHKLEELWIRGWQTEECRELDKINVDGDSANEYPDHPDVIYFFLVNYRLVWETGSDCDHMYMRVNLCHEVNWTPI